MQYVFSLQIWWFSVGICKYKQGYKSHDLLYIGVLSMHWLKLVQVNLCQKHLFSHHRQYDKRLFIDLPVQYMKATSSEHGENMLCIKIVFCFCFDIQNNLCTQHVLLMFSACSFHVLKWLINEPSFVMLWVS